MSHIVHMWCLQRLFLILLLHQDIINHYSSCTPLQFNARLACPEEFKINMSLIAELTSTFSPFPFKSSSSCKQVTVRTSLFKHPRQSQGFLSRGLQRRRPGTQAQRRGLGLFETDAAAESVKPWTEGRFKVVVLIGDQNNCLINVTNKLWMKWSKPCARQD